MLASNNGTLNEPFVRLARVGKTYRGDDGALEVLRSVSIEVAGGQFISILGASGCGKSTLLMMLAGLEPISSGTIEIAGQPVRTPRRDVGIIFQDPTLLPWKSAIENVEFPLALRKVKAAERRRRALPLLDLVGLASFAERYPDELSGGMRQRVAIARCLVQEPRVLLMDEPFAALDEQTRTRMGSELLQIWEKSGGTVVFVTHGLTEAIYLADTVFVMGTRPGRIIERITVPLPRPRTIDMIGSEAFGQLRNRIWHLIAEVRT
jgi:NitT/TauT family transport system ATP-binding protein